MLARIRALVDCSGCAGVPRYPCMPWYRCGRSHGLLPSTMESATIAMLTMHSSECRQSCRAMKFVVRLSESLQSESTVSFKDAGGAAYADILQPYHGFLTYTAFQVCACCLQRPCEWRSETGL